MSLNITKDQYHYRNLDLLDYLELDSRLKMNEFAIDSLCKCELLSFGSLAEKIKPVIMRNREF